MSRSGTPGPCCHIPTVSETLTGHETIGRSGSGRNNTREGVLSRVIPNSGIEGKSLYPSVWPRCPGHCQRRRQTEWQPELAQSQLHGRGSSPGWSAPAAPKSPPRRTRCIAFPDPPPRPILRQQGFNQPVGPGASDDRIVGRAGAMLAAGFLSLHHNPITRWLAR